MRKITEETVKAFMSATAFKKANMQVIVEPNVTVMLLHNNPIAYRYNDPNNTISITTAGWNSNTTKERLNGIINEYFGFPDCIGKGIYQKNYIWYLNDKVWDGELIDINI